MHIPLDAADFLSRAPVDWSDFLDTLPTDLRGNLADNLASLCQAAARAHGYVEMRYGSGCGDQGHDAAVKEANKQLTGVRKVLGFAYPKRACVNF